MYGRIKENGTLEIYRKRYIKIGNTLITNPKESSMREAGYKPILLGDAPTLKLGQRLDISYVDDGDSIRSVYQVTGGDK
ncbi:MAG: hypothetical protein IKC87_03010 [Clostridia bacterium]|nr:hypothetical protein [Clostridia bacterium]